MALRKIKARQIFDCRGDPTLEVDVITDVGLFRSSVPSTVLINPNQAREIRDEDATAYGGRSVFKAVDIVNNVIGPQLIKSNLQVGQQMEIDGLLKKLDGTENKARLGVNSILGVSVACCKAGAAKRGLPVYRCETRLFAYLVLYLISYRSSYSAYALSHRYIAELAENSQLYVPVPSFSVINGGRYAGNNLTCQEFAILPIGAYSAPIGIGKIIPIQNEKCIARTLSRDLCRLAVRRCREFCRRCENEH